MTKHIPFKRIQITNYFKIILLFFMLTTTLLACKKNHNLPDPLEAGWKNKTICELVEENEKFRVLKCTFEPGDGPDKHFHDPYFGYALSGSKFRIKDKNGVKEVNLATGSYFYNEGVEWHEVLNIGDSTAVYLIFEPK